MFGIRSSSKDIGNKIDTSLFVQNPYLRSNYVEANIEEDINMKNHFKIKNLPCPQKNSDAICKSYVDNLFNDSSIIKNTAHRDLNDINITNARFIQVNQLPQIDSHLTAKLYVDNSIDEPTLVRNNQDNDFRNYNLAIIYSITLNKPAENDNQVVIKAYVDQFHQENERSRRDIGLDFYNESSDSTKNNQDNDLNDKKLKNIDSITVNRNPTSVDEVSNKKYVDDSIGEGTILRFNQTLQNYLKVSVGNDTYNLNKYDKIQYTDTTIIKYPNTVDYLLQNWVIKCNDKNNNGKIQNFIKSTKTNSPTGSLGAESLPPIGDAFSYIETSGSNNGNNVYVILERTDIIQNSNIKFFYKRISI